MAINKFTTPNTCDLTTFYNWLQQNKTGTFLADMTITLQGATNSESTLTIASTHATITIKFKSTASLFNVCSYVGANGTWNCPSNGTSYSAAYTQLAGAVLCANGMIIKTYSNNSATQTVYNYFALTADDTGEIAAIYPDRNINATDVQGYKVVAYKSITTSTVTLMPAFNTPLTALSPIVPTSSPAASIPNVFAALHTQQDGLGLAAVKIGNDSYITNGYWYVKD